MTEQLPKSIAEIRELAPKLNASTDQANRVVAAVEKFLNEETNCGIPAYQEFFYDEDEGRKVLGYERVGDKFRIAITYYVPQLNDGGNEMLRDTDGAVIMTLDCIKPWSECSRADKLASFSRLPDLLNGIASVIRNHIEKTDEVVATVGAVLEALKGQRTDTVENSTSDADKIRFGKPTETLPKVKF